MRKPYLILVCGFLYLAEFAGERNADRPLEGEWDFRPQKVWELDNANDAPFGRTSELRASKDEMLYFHDFDRNISHIFDSDGILVNSFAEQGTATGEVDRYMNCFLAGDKVVIGTPGRLHFYSEHGTFIDSFENNLFERFPLLFLDENVFLYTPQEMGQPLGDIVKITSSDLRTRQEKVVTEFSVTEQVRENLPVVILGLTPQVRIDRDPKTKRLYYGRSDDYTIHVSDLDGNLFSFGIDRKRKSVSIDEKRKHFETCGIPKDRYERILPALPDELTQFMQIQVVQDWIFVYSTESLERQQEKIAVDIFSSEGKYYYRSYLKFGEAEPLYTHVEKVTVRGNNCYALLENRNGDFIFAKFEISLPPYL